MTFRIWIHALRDHDSWTATSLNYFCKFYKPLGEDFSDLSTDRIKTAYRYTVTYIGCLLFNI